MAQCGALQKLLENTRLAARSNIALASAAEFCANAGCECAVDLEKCSACLLNSEVLLETVSKCTLETAQETIRACESLQRFPFRISIEFAAHQCVEPVYLVLRPSSSSRVHFRGHFMHAEYVRCGLEATVNMMSTNIKDLSGIGTEQRDHLNR
jgi:hypothetical protein